MFKQIKIAVAVASLSLSGAAFAHQASIQGQANIAGQLTITQATASGNAGSGSTGSAVTSAFTNGDGNSFQTANNSTGGNAAIGAKLSPSGVSVTSSSNEWSTSTANGTTAGTAPAFSSDGSLSVENGANAFGENDSTSGVTSSFAAQQVGVKVAIQGGASGFEHGFGGF